MAAHRHFTSKLLMKWRGSDGLQLLNWQSLKLLVLRSQVSSINHHCYWFVVDLWAGAFECAVILQQSCDYHEVTCSGFQAFVITHFHAIVSTLVTGSVESRRDVMWCYHMCGRLAASWLPTLFSYFTDHTELCLLLIKVLCFHAAWNETLLSSFSVFLLPKFVLPIIIYAFWWPFIFLLTLFRKLLEPLRDFTLKVNSSVCDSFIIVFWTWWLRLIVLWTWWWTSFYKRQNLLMCWAIGCFSRSTVFCRVMLWIHHLLVKLKW